MIMDDLCLVLFCVWEHILICIDGRSTLTPAQIYTPLLRKTDFAREFEAGDYPEFCLT